MTALIVSDWARSDAGGDYVLVPVDDHREAQAILRLLHEVRPA